MTRHALVLGASGISGWALTNQLLRNYPRPGVWSQITALSRKPMSEEECLHWPKDERLRLVSEFDVHNDPEEVLKRKFKEKIPDVNTVTQVYYLVHDPPPNPNDKDPHAISLNALRKTVTILDSLAPSLEFIYLQYGTFIYGLCFQWILNILCHFQNLFRSFRHHLATCLRFPDSAASWKSFLPTKPGNGAREGRAT
ncbi:hypothetical protein DIZ76_016642 [Coccidioides immitis]|nr:hypothetical protein DIZ76_016642 [Coccidioides immitis]